MPASAARVRPAASARLEITRIISAGKSPLRAASSSACMLLPRPEMRTATFRFMSGSGPRAFRAADDASVPAVARGHTADAVHGLTMLLEQGGRGVGLLGGDDHHHADAAIEDARH